PAPETIKLLQRAAQTLQKRYIPALRLPLGSPLYLRMSLPDMKIRLDLPPQIRVFAAFFIYSFCMGSLYPRIPAIQQAMGVGEGALGLALIGPGVGTILSLTFAGPVLERIGYRRVLVGGIPLLSALYALAVWSPNPLTLFLLLI